MILLHTVLSGHSTPLQNPASRPLVGSPPPPLPPPTMVCRVVNPPPPPNPLPQKVFLPPPPCWQPPSPAFHIITKSKQKVYRFLV